MPEPAFRTGIDLVEVNVIARDAAGKPLADLMREEFQLFDNGAARAIRLFLGPENTSAPSLSGPKQINTFSNQIATAGSQTGYTAILIDDLYSGSDPTNEEGSTLSRLQALKLLRALPEGETVAIYAPGLKFQVICEFTSDRDLLERQLRKWKPTPATPAPETHSFLTEQPGPALETRSRAREEAARIDFLRRTDAGDFQLTALADHLAGIPGRKKLIWLANKFPIGPRALQSLYRAGVSIYPVDIDGVCRLCPLRPKQEMNAMAAVTGGVAYYGRNDIAAAMREAIDDGRLGYTLGFYASFSDASAVGVSGVHRLRVAVSRPGVALRYAATYEPSAPPQNLTIADLVRAMDRPVDATSIPFRASVMRVQDRLSLDGLLDVKSLDLIEMDGRWTGKMEFVARFTTADALLAADPIASSVSFNLTQDSYDAALRSGVSYHKEFPIPSKAAELKLLFANIASGKIGTLTIPLSQIGRVQRR